MSSRLVRFLILCVVGFGLGAGLAFLQSRSGAAPSAEVVVPGEEMVAGTTEEIVAGAPEMPEPASGEAAVVSETKDVTSADDTAVAGSQVGGPFSLVDHTGNFVTEKSWPGKFKLVFFGFTNCPDICPAGLQKISTVMEQYDGGIEKLQPLFITVDAARDNMQVMAQYLKAFNPAIVGLTGTAEQLKAVQDSYKVYASKEEDHAGHAGMINHSGFVYLMSPDDTFLLSLPSDAPAEEMLAKIRAAVDSIPVAPDRTTPIPVPQDETVPAQSGEAEPAAPAVPVTAETAPVVPVEDPSVKVFQPEGPAVSQPDTSAVSPSEGDKSTPDAASGGLPPALLEVIKRKQQEKQEQQAVPVEGQ